MSFVRIIFSLLLVLIFFFSYGDSTGACPVTGSDTNTLPLSSCGEFGTCVAINPIQNHFVCLCNRNYAPTGPSDDKCKPIDVCQSEYTSGKICYNEGVCNHVDNDITKYTCTCQAGYSGTNCQVRSTACDDSGETPKCLNGGVCIIDPSAATLYTCQCPNHYAGPNCGSATQLGIGGSGVALRPFTLILCWGLWLFMALTFLYCISNLLIEWWRVRFTKAITG